MNANRLVGVRRVSLGFVLVAVLIAAQATGEAPGVKQGECTLGAVAVTGPADGSVFLISEGLAGASLALIAEVDCVYDTASVSFSLDGEEVESVSAPPYEAWYDDVTALSVAEHTVTALAVSADNYDSTFEASSTFTLAIADAGSDSDGNGLPDDPFVELPLDGDRWASSVTVSETGNDRLVGVARWDGGEGQGPVPIRLVNPAVPGQQVTVTAQGAMLGEGEIGILIVAAAPDLDTLLGPDEAANVRAAPAGKTLLSGSLLLQVSILVSQDGGASYAEATKALLSRYPVHILMEGLAPHAGYNQALFSYPTSIDSDPVTGIHITAEDRRWERVRKLEMTSGTVDVDLNALSLFAVYESEDRLELWTILGVLALVTPAGIAISEGGKAGGGGPCFIATAAYGTPLAPHLYVLREVRDTWLMDNALGAACVDAYYHASPILADSVARHPYLAGAVRLSLAPVILLSRVALGVGLLPVLLVAAGLTGLGYRRWSRERH